MKNAVPSCSYRAPVGCKYSRIFKNLGLVLLALLNLSVPRGHAGVIDDVVVLNKNDPERTVDISSNDVTGGDCSDNNAADPIASCPCPEAEGLSALDPDLGPALVSLSIKGTFTYEPGPGVSGVDVFEYLGFEDTVDPVACDLTNIATISVIINDTPTLTSVIPDVTVVEDTMVDEVIDLSTHFDDTDIGGPAFPDELSFEAVAISNPGLFDSVSVVGSTLTLAFAPDKFGVATIQVTATDNRASLAAIANFTSGNSVSTTFEVTVTPANDAPVALDDVGATDEDVAVILSPLGNDTDIDGDTLSLAGVGPVTNGDVVDNGDGTLTFTPDANFNGTATVAYTVGDGQTPELTDVGEITVTVNPVNDAPVAVDDAVSADEDVAAIVSPLTNDIDVDGDVLAFVGVPTATAGGVVDNGDGTLTFTPPLDFNGIVTVTYEVGDGVLTDIGQVVITVATVNDPPVVVAGIADFGVLEDAPPTVIDLAPVFGDVDIATNGDGLDFTVVGNTNAALFSSAVVTGATLTLSYAPNQNGAAQITVRASDVEGAVVEDLFVVTVDPVNDAPFVTAEVADIEVFEDGPEVVVLLVPVFDDVDIDLEGDSLSYAFAGSNNPSLFASIDLTTPITGARLTLVLAPHQHGLAAVKVQVEDEGGLTALEMFNVIVTPVNDTPVAADDTLIVQEDVGDVNLDVLANDFTEDHPIDVVQAGITIVIDGEPFPSSTESPPTSEINQLGDPVTLPNGSVVIEDDLSITYTPKDNFSGSDFFTYTIQDPDGEQSTATVSITVTPVNDAPFGFALIEYVIEENSFLDVSTPGLLSDALDPDGDPLTVVLQSPPADGGLVINPDGSFTYTPSVGFIGTDEFTYFISDGVTTNEGDPNRVVIDVTPLPPPPAPPPPGEVEFDFQLANSPLELSAGTEPNVFVLMDDSGSMDWTLSGPEESEGRFRISTRNIPGVKRRTSTIFSYVHDLSTNTYAFDNSIGRIVPSEQALEADNDFDGNRYGVWRARSHTYNKIYYDPQVLYLPWRGLGPNNEFFAAIDPENALLDPMDLATGIDLTVAVNYTSKRVPRMRGSSSAKDVSVQNFYIPRYYATSSSAAVPAWDDPHTLVEIRDNGTTYQGGTAREDCALDDSDPTTCTFAQEIQNFANWFSYYRSREYVAKNSLGRVVADANTIRIGYGVLNDTNDQLPIQTMNATFKAGPKRALMDKLYGINSNGGTPLRSRLDRTGKYFECVSGGIFGSADSVPGDAECPVAAAPAGQCQLNFALVFTDGRWNGSGPSSNRDGPGMGNTDFDGGVYADGVGGTLADVAMHYYERDLHPTLLDEVPTSGRDLAGALASAFGTDLNTMHQHMSTFGIQFGLKGNLEDSDIPGDFTQSVNWGNPFNSSSAKTDDVRHMALNGRGGFLTATNTEQLLATMESVFDEFSAGEGAASAVAFNSQQIQEGNLIFRGFYNTKVNTGDLVAQQLDSNGFPVLPVEWSAALELDRKAPTERTIVTWDGDPTSLSFGEGIAFRHSELSSEQQATLTVEQVDYLRGSRENERPFGLNFRERPDSGGLLGDIVNSTPVFAGPPAFIGRDRESFPTDSGNLYSEFAQANQDRREMVVVSANDGMTHVFDANTGEEIMAFVPDKIINGEPYANELSQLTSISYSHKFFNDLTPSINDVFVHTRTDFTRRWHTVMVGGLRGGGKGYFALDLTDPTLLENEGDAVDQVLWEFTDVDDASPDPLKIDLQGLPIKDLGYSYSQPQIVMTNAEVGASPARKRWAAAFGNGYNSTSGIAKLFVLFIEDGVDGWDLGAGDYVKLDTGFGAPGLGEVNEGFPNGLGTPRLIDIDGNGTADVGFAGDLRGNLFRFDLSDTDPSNWSVTRIFTATYPAGIDDDIPQPITTQPIVIKNPQEDVGFIVIASTGSFVTVPDGRSTDIQSIYGIWDRLEEAPAITRDILVEQDVVNLVDPELGNLRTLTTRDVDYAPPSTTRGWFLDFDAPRAEFDVNGAPNPDESGNATGPQFPGERAIRNQQLRGGFLFVNTVIPRTEESCVASPGGFQMAMNPATGGLGGQREEVAFDLNNDGEFDDQDRPGGDVIAGMRFEDAVPTDSAFIGNRRYTQLSNKEIDVVLTNTQTGSRTGRLSWREINTDLMP